MGKPTESQVIPLVGRRKEVEALVRAIQAGQSRLIVGPPGIGKSRLIAEAISRHSAPSILLEDVVNSGPRLYRSCSNSIIARIIVW